MVTPLEHIFHLYNRAGFGISYKEAKSLSNKSIKEIVDGLFNNIADGNYLRVIGKEDITKPKEMLQSGMSKKEIRQLIIDKGIDLNLKWVEQLLNTTNVLIEKQTLFWHNHFACRVQNPYLIQELNNIHRKFAFSSFRTLLVEVSKSPAMLEFLNNQQNRKEHPNENFARELMELFTLGRGNYTENDIKQSARAFTGWSFSRNSYEFEFREKQHDYDEKEFLNRKGNFGGEDIINIILDDKQTALFLCKKIYKYYVNEIIDETRVKALAEYYYLNQYNTESLLKKIFLSDWFYNDINMGCNIKSPIEYVIGLSRQFKIKYANEKVLLGFQRQLGQVLFFPPNVAGWPGGKNWIDSSTLMLRMRLPSLILNNGDIENDGRIDDPDDMMGISAEQINKKLNTSVNWAEILNTHEGLTLENLSKILLAKQPNSKVINVISTNAANDLKEQIVKLISLPEYNLC
ncbi:MAG TPA: DUF1800 domain-containing protein [Bacteroidia bacterium]|jgi:uncharacterized protein (DUF1800 family)|nr:DUF1800 domain-containing protein [Bacteroidia bacterium]